MKILLSKSKLKALYKRDPGHEEDRRAGIDLPLVCAFSNSYLAWPLLVVRVDCI